MGKIRDAVEGVEPNRGGRPHLFKQFLGSIPAEDAADIVDLLKDPKVSLASLADAVKDMFGFEAHRSTWPQWAADARAGRFDQWASSSPA